MMPIPPEDQPAWESLLGPVVYACDRCGLPAVRTADGTGWMHAEAADAAFCKLICGDE